MSILKEAGYMYKYSKKLLKLNKQLNNLSGEANKHKKRHSKAKDEDKDRHFVKHSQSMADIKEVMKKHNEVLNKLRKHHLNFAVYLKKEHKI